MTCPGSLPMASATLPGSVRLSPKKRIWLNCADAVPVAPTKDRVANNARTKPRQRSMVSPRACPCEVAQAAAGASARWVVRRVYGDVDARALRTPPRGAAGPRRRSAAATAGDETDRAEAADEERE